jgi:hypothetical protein
LNGRRKENIGDLGTPSTIILIKIKKIGLDDLRRVYVVLDREMWLAVFKRVMNIYVA